MEYWFVPSGSVTWEDIFDIVEEGGIVGVYYVGTDLTGLSLDEIRDAISEEYGDIHPITLGNFTRACRNLTGEMQPDDRVITWHGYEKRFLIGSIQGDYRYDPAPEHSFLTHTRSVNWVRTDISQDTVMRIADSLGEDSFTPQRMLANFTQHSRVVDALLQSNGDDHEDNEEEEGGFGFKVERDLQDALAQDLSIIEPGLRLVATEHTVKGGRIDILATDESGNNIVIELKAGTAPPTSINQILAYMGSFEDPSTTRGILIAYDYPERVRLAAQALPNVQLLTYSYLFRFTKV